MQWTKVGGLDFEIWFEVGCASKALGWGWILKLITPKLVDLCHKVKGRMP
jgi:hypothetical protein